VFLAGSGFQFENEGFPLDEDCRLGHSSAYVVARNQSLFAARYYRTLGVKVYFGFLFHHDSPLRSSQHMSMKIAEAAALASTGNSGRLLLGDLDAEKEYTFAGDVVTAIWTFVRQDEISECVIGSGRVYSIRQWAQGCFEHVGLDWANYLGVDPAYSNPCRRLVSNPAKLRSMGWQPKVQFGQLCEMMMQGALKRVTSRGC
jgi:GDPmannose 4,6-dehydratase